MLPALLIRFIQHQLLTDKPSCVSVFASVVCCWLSSLLGNCAEAQQRLCHVSGGADLSGGRQQQAESAECAAAELEGSTGQQGQQGYHKQQQGHQL